jgi:hypothetical protein
MTFKIKELKVDLSKITFKDPAKIRDGTNGKLLEEEMLRQGFPIDSTGIVDLPNGIEVKTRSGKTKAPHTIGTMTYNAIINTAWDQTPFKLKLQTQYRVNIHSSDVATGQIVDLSHPEIQKHFEKAYEASRAELMRRGTYSIGETISGGQYGMLEHKPGPNRTGKSFAFRIPNSGMKKLLNISNMLKRGFEFT